MKQNNRFNRNNRNNPLEKNISCSCGARAKLKIRKNYSHGKKSNPVISQSYECKECGKVKVMGEKQKGGRR